MTTTSRTTTMSAASAAEEREIEIQLAGRRARTRRTAWVWAGRIGVAVLVIGGWQWFTSAGWVDKFFYGQPSGIWDSLVRLFT
ncbi:hypothetical protein SB767_32400, partial [Bacillus sp. SIMBA_069]